MAQETETGAGSRDWREVNITSQDGLNLHGRDYGPHSARAMPVVCLPGLSRTGRDFHDLALRLSTGRQARRVLAFDLRGRGGSDHDPKIANYTPQREALDVIDMAAATGVGECVVVGTSRGGIVAMVMATMRPGLVRGVVLNDIGPRVEAQGLMRIAAQLKSARQPGDWGDAVALVRQMHQDQFTDLTQEQWSKFTHELYIDQEGRPVRDYDPKIAASLDAQAIANGEIPEIWALFAALKPIQVAVVRGENSDILSTATVGKMRRQHPALMVTKVANRGHTPFLTEPESIKAVDELLASVEKT